MASFYGNILEEALKNKVAADWFDAYDCTDIIGKIDFAVCPKVPATTEGTLFTDREYLLWAEAKQGTTHDIYESFIQLILTIGKARTCDSLPPPPFLGAFDAEKIAFIPYTDVMDVFAQNDFNWNVAPSNHATKEFLQLHTLVKSTLESNTYIYFFANDGMELRAFIRNNFHLNPSNTATIRINKNNFTHVYLKWLREVKPTIAMDWDEEKKEGIIDADFYLADILSEDNATIKDKLFVLLQHDRYKYNITRKKSGAIKFDEVEFNDGQKAHTRFWRRYQRPPEKDYWDYIVNRRDLLVPQDIRERKGSFFTPRQWVELSQEYIARSLGENWQDEYYVWDCCAGTGNLLAGLTNKYNIYASTLDNQDVRVMKDLIQANKLNLLDDHVFQFDFLNGDFHTLPQSLQDIINNPEERRKLIVYINPPYAEAANIQQRLGRGQNRRGVALEHSTYLKYRDKIGKASNELFAQFFIRIYDQIPDCVLAEFSKIKFLQSSNFRTFRNVFKAKLCRSFLVPANTFDNVNGKFPIGFFVWKTSEKEEFEKATVDVYDKDANFCGTKVLYSYNDRKLITDWMKEAHDKENPRICYLRMIGSDVYNANGVFLTITPSANDLKKRLLSNVTAKNLLHRCVYFYVRHCMDSNWLTNDEQFLYPNDTWQEDLEFQSDCLAYTLFSGWNYISMKGGVNHWIPFPEEEVGARDRYQSHFMLDFLRGKLSAPSASTLFDPSAPAPAAPIAFSPAARTVLDAAKEIYRYYHSRPGAHANAAFYDIRLFFQGTNDSGRMNSSSPDETYNTLLATLRSALRSLANQIKPKVYTHAFLME